MAVKRKRFDVKVKSLSEFMALAIQIATLIELALRLAHHT